MNDLIDPSQGPDDDLVDALIQAEADRDRARAIAVALEQEVAMLTTERHRFTEDYARLYAEAEAAHGVIEQVGLLQEALDGIGAGEMLRRILNGATFEEVRNG